MTVKGGTSPACAACKYQRRKCSSKCILAPYFPANQPKVFQNVHRLFGVSKITKLLKELETNEQKEDALKSIKYESEMRERFPVYGCLTIIYQLRQQLQQAVDELQYVHAQLAICRDQFNGPSQIASPPPHGLQFAVAPNCIDHNNSNNNNNNNNNNNALSVTQHQSAVNCEMAPFLTNTPTYLPNTNYGAVFNESSHDNNVAKVLFGLDTYCDMVRTNNNSIPIQGQYVPSDAAFGIQQEREVSQEYEDMIFNAMADDRQSYIETKEAACESSSESSLRETTQSIEQVSKSELRDAAACFSLISAN